MCNCSKNKSGSIVKNKCCGINYTGDTYYDGNELRCANDADFTLEKDDDLNVILGSFYEQICLMKTPVIISQAAIVEDFSEDWAPVTDITVTAPVTGNYKVTGIINYRHAEDTGVVVQNCQGLFTVMKIVGVTETPITTAGVMKSLASELNDATPFNNDLVATVVHTIALNAGEKMALAIQSSNPANRYTNIGGQLMLERIPSFTVEVP